METTLKKKISYTLVVWIVVEVGHFLMALTLLKLATTLFRHDEF